MEKLSAAMENYLKTIYILYREEGVIRASYIASKMGVTKASVCRATDILSQKGLVTKNKYYSLALTPKGLKQAELITNRYNIIHTFLNEILDIEPSVAEKDACSFEHNISLESLQSMHQYLKIYRQKQKCE
ncbi:metal-dependent transcriptional regulator [Aminipila butyrica]|uniref:Manganese transport regulator n=1 Tax=Aminipila butyrica TaxID=433296 RepID=A0A858BWF1_9FIRM|nr:metal-dependent transcriptional regulator [Aminipila butyrica]QIB69907.1 metal-dependent transcriptional regulator [Aminipila butyrica]